MSPPASSLLMIDAEVPIRAAHQESPARTTKCGAYLLRCGAPLSWKMERFDRRLRTSAMTTSRWKIRGDVLYCLLAKTAIHVQGARGFSV